MRTQICNGVEWEQARQELGKGGGYQKVPHKILKNILNKDKFHFIRHMACIWKIC